MTSSHVASTLLVPLDGSELAETALGYAKLLGSPDTTYVLLRVTPANGHLAGRVDPERLSAAASSIEAEFKQSAAMLGAGAKVSLLTASGDPATVIVEQAAAIGATAIVIATHGRGAIGRWLHGSISDRVARTSPIPVVILRGDEGGTTPHELTRILLPYDGSETARAVIPAAGDIALAQGLQVHILTAVDVTSIAPVSVPGAVMPVSGDIYEEVYDQLVAEARTEAATAAALFHDRGITATTEVRVGPPAVAVEDVLQPGDLIALSSHGRSGVQRWLLGSVAEQLIRAAPAPVMLVPAAGRETATA
jgi:nucleotide-binding universal stress UspA family protein